MPVPVPGFDLNQIFTGLQALGSLAVPPLVWLYLTEKAERKEMTAKLLATIPVMTEAINTATNSINMLRVTIRGDDDVPRQK